MKQHQPTHLLPIDITAATANLSRANLHHLYLINAINTPLAAAMRIERMQPPKRS
jgi:hypothetical protein